MKEEEDTESPCGLLPTSCFQVRNCWLSDRLPTQTEFVLQWESTAKGLWLLLTGVFLGLLSWFPSRSNPKLTYKCDLVILLCGTQCLLSCQGPAFSRYLQHSHWSFTPFPFICEAAQSQLLFRSTRGWRLLAGMGSLQKQPQDLLLYTLNITLSDRGEKPRCVSSQEACFHGDLILLGLPFFSQPGCSVRSVSAGFACLQGSWGLNCFMSC